MTLWVTMLANVPSHTVGKTSAHNFALGDAFNVVGYDDSVCNIDGDPVVDRDGVTLVGGTADDTGS